MAYISLLHVDCFGEATPLHETMGALDTAVKSGKALYAGISNYNAEQTEKCVKILKNLNCPFIINQSSYSIFNRNIETNGLLEKCNKLGIGIIAFSPLSQGLLTDKYLLGIPKDSRIKKSGKFLNESALTEKRLWQINALNEMAKLRGEALAQMALAFVLQKGCTSVLIGASSPEQIMQNVKAASAAPFTQDELLKIDEIAL